MYKIYFAVNDLKKLLRPNIHSKNRCNYSTTVNTKAIARTMSQPNKDPI
jgi:hypothetical protein